LSVTNGGDDAETFVVEALASPDDGQLRVDEAWIEFDAERFQLDAGGGRVVSVRLRLPNEAEIGDYRVLLRARVAVEEGSSGGGAVVSAAVATVLTFSVENRNFHFYDPLVDFFQDRSPFSYLGVSLIGGVAIAYLFQRRFRLRIGFGLERRD
jgi:hypothetical protein